MRAKVIYSQFIDYEKIGYFIYRLLESAQSSIFMTQGFRVYYSIYAKDDETELIYLIYNELDFAVKLAVIEIEYVPTWEYDKFKEWLERTIKEFPASKEWEDAVPLESYLARRLGLYKIKRKVSEEIAELNEFFGDEW